MRRGGPHGYTIVEVMVFLAVTGALFAMIVLTFAGQRGRTQFSTAARDIESRVQDITNDVSTGFYPGAENFTCQEVSNAPDIQAGSAPQGTNVDCIFLGRVIHFRVGGNGNRYMIYSVVGLRQVDGQDATNYDDAEPTTDLLLAEDLRLPGNVSVAYVRTNDTPPDNINAIGFFSTLGSYSEEGTTLESGSLSVNTLSVVGNGGLPSTPSEMVNFINTDIDDAYVASNQNPANGITICLNSGTSNQRAFLTVGGSGRQLNTDLRIESGACV